MRGRMPFPDPITPIAIIVIFISVLITPTCLKIVNRKSDEDKGDSTEAEIESPSTQIAIERLPTLPYPNIHNISSGEVRYSADSIIHDSELKQIILTGSVWHIQGDHLTDGRGDTNAVLVLDSDSLNIIRSEGRFEKSILLK